MKMAFPLLLLFHSLIVAAQPNEGQIIFTGGHAYEVIQTHILPVTYMIRDMNKKELIDIYPYYGEAKDGKKGIIIRLVTGGKYAFIPGMAEATTEVLIKELDIYKLLQGAYTDPAAVRQFLEKHPLPTGYLPPEEAGYY